MASSDSTPPVLRFAMRVLEATGTAHLAEGVCTAMVDLFGAVGAAVVGPDGVVAQSGDVPVQAGPGRVLLPFTLAGSARDGDRVQLVVAARPGPDLPIIRGQFVDLASVVRRAWERAAGLEIAHRTAREDPLTGLDNRRSMEEFLAQAFLQVRHTGRPLTVMIVDLDHFKAVNDRQGHPAGDEVLQLAATCFRAHLRGSDRIGRWGGDEFLIALRGIGADAAVPIADRLRDAFARDDRARGATMTIGIADTDGLPTDALAVAELVALADAVLYEAKRAGRNRIAVAPSLTSVAC